MLSRGLKRASSLIACSCQPAGSNWVRKTSPVEMSPRHSPAPWGPLYRAARKLFLPSSSMFSSMRVPGVTTRMTSRSTRPLAWAGSSVCSQMATLYPLAMSREI